MVIKTKEFIENCKIISGALDTISNIELSAVDNTLYLNITNKEYYVSVKYALDTPEEFRAVVNAKLFIELITNITAETFELTVSENAVIVKVGKSKYKLAMVYENNTLMELPKIILTNKTVEMPISADILQSIVNINSKELQKVKNIANVNELQKLYYITEEGCFSFTTGACMNKFTLSTPIKLLLNDRIVKLFKLFKEDVSFSFGHDLLANGMAQTKAVFETANIYIAALVTNDEVLLSSIQRPYLATKQMLTENLPNKLVLSVSGLSTAIARLLLFSKNSSTETDIHFLPVTVTVTGDDFIITDKFGNNETLVIENGSFISSEYTFTVGLFDLKLVLDSCKDEQHITFNCGNNRTIVIAHENILNLIPEHKRI